MKNKIYLFFAIIFVGLGFLAAAIPLIPSTPFIFLAGYFGTKGSDKFREKFLASKIYRIHLLSFQENNSLSLASKKRILFVATFSILLLTVISNSILLRIIYISVLLFKYFVFIFIIPTFLENPSI